MTPVAISPAPLMIMTQSFIALSMILTTATSINQLGGDTAGVSSKSTILSQTGPRTFTPSTPAQVSRHSMEHFGQAPTGSGYTGKKREKQFRQRIWIFLSDVSDIIYSLSLQLMMIRCVRRIPAVKINVSGAGRTRERFLLR